MRYAGLIENDLANAPGICVSVFVQGCHHHCPECFNPETWDFYGGKEFTHETLNSIIEKLQANGIHRDFCLLGGEPLCPENLFLSHLIIKTIKEKLPDTKIYVWTGYLYEDLIKREDNHTKRILELADTLIDGPYIAAEKDTKLLMRGSRNQRIINLHEENE